MSQVYCQKMSRRSSSIFKPVDLGRSQFAKRRLQTVLAYKQVPQEVYRRLCSASPYGAKSLGDLFGRGD